MENYSDTKALTTKEQTLKYEVGYIYSFIGAFAISRFCGGILIFIIRNIILMVENAIIQGRI